MSTTHVTRTQRYLVIGAAGFVARDTKDSYCTHPLAVAAVYFTDRALAESVAVDFAGIVAEVA